MIYAFKCDCGSTREIEQSIHVEIINPICTDCHQSMSRSWSSPAVTFKGPGFYSNGGQKALTPTAKEGNSVRASTSGRRQLNSITNILDDPLNYWNCNCVSHLLVALRV